MQDIGQLGRVFYYLCIILGVLSILIGGAMLFYSFQLSSQLSSSLSSVDSALSSSSRILSNITVLTSSAASSSSTLSHNLTRLLNNFSNSISAIQNSLQHEANIFHNGSPAQYYPQGTQQIGDNFQSLATQFGFMNSQGIPPLKRLINNTLSKASAPLTNISKETSALNSSLSALAIPFRGDIASAQSTIPALFLVLGLYVMLHGVLFIMLGMIITTLLTQGLEPVSEPEAKNKKRKEAKDDSEPSESEEKKNENSGKGNSGMLQSIKDAFGID